MAKENGGIVPNRKVVSKYWYYTGSAGSGMFFDYEVKYTIL